MATCFASAAAFPPADQGAPPWCSVSPSPPLAVLAGHRRGMTAFRGVRRLPSLPAAMAAPSRRSVCRRVDTESRLGGAVFLGVVVLRCRPPKGLRRFAWSPLRLRRPVPRATDGARPCCSSCVPLSRCPLTGRRRAARRASLSLLARCRGAVVLLGVPPRPSLRTADGAPSCCSGCTAAPPPFLRAADGAPSCCSGCSAPPCSSLRTASGAPSHYSLSFPVPGRRRRGSATTVRVSYPRRRPPKGRRRFGRCLLFRHRPFPISTARGPPRSLAYVPPRPCRPASGRRDLPRSVSPSPLAADGASSCDVRLCCSWEDGLLCVLVVDRELAVLSRDVGRGELDDVGRDGLNVFIAFFVFNRDRPVGSFWQRQRRCPRRRRHVSGRDARARARFAGGGLPR